MQYIKFAKELGVDAVCFRKPHGTLEPSEQEILFKDFLTIKESSCPVCRIKWQYINDMQVFWKASALEPSKDLNSVYEAIIQTNGDITTDWAGNIKMNKVEATALEKIADSLIMIGQQLKQLTKANKTTKEINTSTPNNSGCHIPNDSCNTSRC
jgi:hypothetical protein